MKCLAVYLLSFSLSVFAVSAQITLVHRWKSPVFKFPSAAAKTKLTKNGSYVPNTGVILDVDRHVSTSRTFVTLPHFATGTSVTLAYVAEKKVDNPLLMPYPDWSWHQPGNCNGLVSVFRMKIDECGRLWAIDSGKDDVFTTFNQTCPPKIMVFDLATNKLIRKYVFPPIAYEHTSLFIGTEVEVEGLCSDTFAYVHDVVGHTILVYDFANDSSWIVNSTTFNSDPGDGNFTISGSSFTLSDGILGTTLSPRDRNGCRVLYYHSLASNCENYVSTSVLKNESNFRNGENLVPNEFHKCFGTRPAQSASEAMDSSGHLFYSLLPENSIYCWDWKSDYNTNQHKVVRNNAYLQFPSGMKAIKRRNNDEIWAISCRFQIIATTGLDRSQYNFHIVRGDATKMISRSGC